MNERSVVGSSRGHAEIYLIEEHTLRLSSEARGKQLNVCFGDTKSLARGRAKVNGQNAAPCRLNKTPDRSINFDRPVVDAEERRCLKILQRQRQVDIVVKDRSAPRHSNRSRWLVVQFMITLTLRGVSSIALSAVIDNARHHLDSWVETSYLRAFVDDWRRSGYAPRSYVPVSPRSSVSNRSATPQSVAVLESISNLPFTISSSIIMSHNLNARGSVQP
jgi:hypothetical protein